MSHWTEELFLKDPEIFLNYFNLEIAPAEVDYLLERIKENGFKADRILDMNCGIGRHSVECARHGVQVVGTDLSPLYVKVAKERAVEAKLDDKVSFRVADMRNIAELLAGEEPFDGIICLWTSLGFYDEATEEDILKQCGRLVKPGGFFAVDIINRDWLMQHYAVNAHRVIGDYRVLEENAYDIKQSKNITTWTYLKKKDGGYEEVKKVNLELRLWSPHELIALFEKAGFTHKGIYSGFVPSPPTHELTSINPLEFMRQVRLLYISGK